VSALLLIPLSIQCVVGTYCVHSVTRGIGEMDISQPPAESNVSPADDACPYLILDIRDRDEYDACHLITGNALHRSLTCNYVMHVQYVSHSILLT